MLNRPSHTDTKDETLACCPREMTHAHRKVAKDFIFPIIYPNTASSETKQLGEKFSNFDLSQDTFFYTEVLFLTVSTCDLF